MATTTSPGERTDQPGDLVADAQRQIDPGMLRPAPDEIVAPLGLDDSGDPRCRRLGQGAERVAVEIDDPLRQREAIAEGGERIGAVERYGIGTVEAHLGSSRKTARTGAASRPARNSGKAISS